jgi:excisionase family DNA binding protein
MSRTEPDRWPEYLDFKTLARYCSLCERTLRNLAKEPDFPTVRVGRRVLVPRAAFDSWMLARSAPRPEPASLLTLIRDSRPARRDKA